MVLDNKSIKLNGLFGNSYTLSLTTEQDNIISTPSNRLNFRIEISKIDFTDNTKLRETVNDATLVLYINDMIYSKIPFAFNFSQVTDLVFRVSDIDIMNEEPKVLNVKLELLYNHEFKYIEDTTLTTLIYVNSIVKDNASISLSSSELLNEFKFKVNTIDDYDLLEYKVNDNPWIKLDDKTFTLQKQNKNLYVQARIKKNNQYFYSNVFRYKII